MGRPSGIFLFSTICISVFLSVFFSFIYIFVLLFTCALTQMDTKCNPLDIIKAQAQKASKGSRWFFFSGLHLERHRFKDGIPSLKERLLALDEGSEDCEG